MADDQAKTHRRVAADTLFPFSRGTLVQTAKMLDVREGPRCFRRAYRARPAVRDEGAVRS